MIRLLLSAGVVALAALGAYLHITLRLARDSAAAPVFRSAWSSDIVVAAITFAATLGVVIALIHARRRMRLPLFVASLLLLAASALSTRELQYARSTGEVRQAWALLPPAPVQTIGVNQNTCFDTGTLEVSLINPATGKRAKVFRGIGPWGFEAGELRRLAPEC